MYGNDNPVKYSDPSGMFSLNEISQAFAIVSVLSAVRVAGTALLNDVVTDHLGGNIHWTGAYESVSASPILLSEGLIMLQAYFDGKISERGYAFVGIGTLSFPLPISFSASTLDVFSPTLLGTGVQVLSGSFSMTSAAFVPGYAPTSASAFAMGFGFGYSLGNTVGFDIGLSLGISGVSIPFFWRDKAANKPPIRPYYI